MPTIHELLHDVEQLEVGEKWQLVRHILATLEHSQTAPDQTSDWHQFLRETYGSLRDTPIQRYEQGEYEERELIE